MAAQSDRHLTPANRIAADRLREAALLLAQQGDNPFRVAAYRRAADAVDVLEYRLRAEKNELRKIAPKRFNPSGEAWLPILHTRRGDWHFTALYSNTARAHELDNVHDWGVIYFHSDGGSEAQRTVVTESRGALAGHRVVRGRERECLAVHERPPEQRSRAPAA